MRTVRTFLAASTLIGFGPLLYSWLWLTVPRQDPVADQAETRLAAPLLPEAQPRRASLPRQLGLAGVGVLGVAALLLAAQIFWNWEWQVPTGIVMILAGLALAWLQIPRLGRWRDPGIIGSYVAGIFLLIAGIVLLVTRAYPGRVMMIGGGIGALIVVGLLAALAPLLLGMYSNLSTSRIRQARETERADIAAHLHDSVLQTLTLVRAGADDPARVRALALAQERELRTWLYTGRDNPGTSTAQLLRDRVATAEEYYGVPVDVVCVGDRQPGPAELALVAAAGEAVTNALRHGAPPVSVYLEARPDQLEIFVKDSGDGFDLAQVPPDRHGVRDSIVGRVERVGGTAKLRCRPGRGAEVHLSVGGSEDPDVSGAAGAATGPAAPAGPDLASSSASDAAPGGSSALPSGVSPATGVRPATVPESGASSDR